MGVGLAGQGMGLKWVLTTATLCKCHFVAPVLADCGWTFQSVSGYHTHIHHFVYCVHFYWLVGVGR